MKKHLLPVSFLAACLYLGIAPATVAQEVKPTTAAELKAAVEQHQKLKDNTIFSGYAASNLGPIKTSGRIIDIEVSSDTKTFYIAAASGGVFKTTDNGQSFKPIFDHHSALGIGDMAIAPSDNNIIWVGTGENNSSRSTYAGSGVYKSTDAGETWTLMGLPFSQHIGQIIIHPTNPDIVWVGAMGSLYSQNSERGLYKTTDGGKTWKRTLYVDDNTGVIQITINPENPNQLLAATWERFRQANNFIGSGDGSAIWRSEDGGETWAKSVDGFPLGDFVGRIGIEYSQSEPNVVYVLHDSQKEKTTERPANRGNQEGLSFDKFKTMSAADVQALDNKELEQFLRRNGFATKYTAEVVKKEVRIGKITPVQIANYNGSGNTDANAAIINSTVTGAEVYRSEDSGKSWKKVSESDLSRLYNTYGYYFGELRVSTQDANEIFVLGVPLMVSRDGGKTFATSDSVGGVHSDHQSMWINPKDSKHILLGTDGGLYQSYGGGERWTHINNMQIGQFYSIMVDHAEPYNVYGGLQDNGVWSNAHNVGYQNGDWKRLAGGDGMAVAVDTRTNDIVYTGSQFGSYARVNTTTGERKSITPRHDIGNQPNRWNWRTPIILSRFNQDIVYMSSQYLYRSMDRGETWETISGDLTKNLPQGNVPFSTTTWIAESHQEFGNLYVGTDDGNLWMTRDNGRTWTAVNKGLPQGRWISSIETSPHYAGTVFVTLTGYRNDDFKAHVFKSTDYGKTWTSVAGNLPAEATNIIRQDLKNENMLYVGTDHGLYISMDGGKNYDIFQGSVPNVAVYDMIIQPKENHLVVGTHGRSIYIIDLNPMHAVKDMNTAAVVMANDQRFNPRWAAFGINSNAWMMAYLPSSGTATATILNDKGNTVRTITIDAKKGFNTIGWDFKDDSGEYIRPGKFSLKITAGNQSDTKAFEIR